MHLRTADGRHFLQAVAGGGGDLNATGPWAKEWETFDLVACDAAAGGFPAGASVAVRTFNGYNYLQAEGGGGGTVNARGPWQREWETFTLVLPPGVARLAPGGSFGLMAQNHQLVSAHGGEPVVGATASDLGPEQTFVDIDVVDSAGQTTLQGQQASVKVTLSSDPTLGDAGAQASAQGPRSEERRGDFVCSVQPMTITQKFDEAMLLDPMPDVLWPGNVVDGSRWVSGECRPVVAPRAPLTLSLSLESYAGAPVSTVVQSPANSSVRTALNQLRTGLVGAPRGTGPVRDRAGLLRRPAPGLARCRGVDGAAEAVEQVRLLVVLGLQQVRLALPADLLHGRRGPTG